MFFFVFKKTLINMFAAKDVDIYTVLSMLLTVIFSLNNSKSSVICNVLVL